jgi:L-aminopeptidase/D-esterase-like protein
MAKSPGRPIPTLRAARFRMLVALLAALPAAAAERPAPEKSSAPSPTAHGLTAVPRLLVGHAAMEGRPTGCTVIRIDGLGDPRRAGATGGVDVRGGAPGTRETELLRPENLVEQVNAVVLAGGSAFGLEAATGAVRWLERQGIGFDVGVAKVPIVASAILFDLPVGGRPDIRPDAQCGERAAAAATAGPVAEGNVGAGLGATIGKSAGMERAMKGGVGSAALRLEHGAHAGLTVGALAAVNALGDIVDPRDGRLVAGVRGPGDHLADARRLLRHGDAADFFAQPPSPPAAGGNTTLVVVATNARLSKAQATKVAQMAQDGLARTLYPAHTPYDGDTVFVLATGDHPGAADVAVIGALAADAVAEAILRGVRAAESLPGLPAARDLKPLEAQR